MEKLRQAALLVKLPHSGDVRSSMDGWLKVALGEQTVDVWKNAFQLGEAAAEIAAGRAAARSTPS